MNFSVCRQAAFFREGARRVLGTLWPVSSQAAPQISVSFEGINLTEEGMRTYGRDKVETFFMQEGSARYLLGARFKF